MARETTKLRWPKRHIPILLIPRRTQPYTDEYWTLKREVAELIKDGHLREYLTEKGREIAVEADKNWQSLNLTPVANAEEEKVINMIAGGSEICRLTRLAAKSKFRETQSIYNIRNGLIQGDCTLTFTEKEASGINAPHHDALVIKIAIANLTV